MVSIRLDRNHCKELKRVQDKTALGVLAHSCFLNVIPGGRFDLRLPYADQGYVDEDADAMKKLTNFFGGGKKKAANKAEPVQEEPPKKKNWPW